MGMEVGGWYWSQAGRDRAQEENINALHSQIARERRRQTKTRDMLRSQIAELSGSMTERIDTLGRALDAFVELSDLRFELQAHQATAAARDRVRQFVIRAADSSQPPEPHLGEDVPGYWLLPAVRGFAEQLHGRDGGTDLAAARALDPHRTALFLTTAHALTGRHEQAVATLRDALGRPPAPGTLSIAQRHLWHAATTGAFGPAGLDTVRDWLRPLLPAEPSDEDRTAWRAIRDSLPAATVEPRQVAAAERLTALHDVTARLLRGYGDLGGRPDPKPLFALMEAVVDEGSIIEAPLLRRAQALRDQVADRTNVPVPPPHFDDPAETAEALLSAAFTDGDAPPAARAVAVVLGTERVGDIADRLCAEAVSALPYAQTVRATGVKVAVRATGAVPEQYADVLATLEKRALPEPNGRWLGAAIAATAAVIAAAVAAVTVSGGLWVLAVALCFAAVPLWRKWASVREENSTGAIGAVQTRRYLDEQIARIQPTLAERERRCAEAAVAARTARTELTALLKEYR